MVRSDSIGKVKSLHRPVRNIDAWSVTDAISITGVEFVSEQAVIFCSEWDQAGDDTASDIDHRQSVVFLQRDKRCLRISRNCNALGLQILRHSCVRSVNSDASRNVGMIVRTEAGSSNVSLSE